MWIIQPPMRCPNGHEFGPHRALVGSVACLGLGGGHTTWTCQQHATPVYRLLGPSPQLSAPGLDARAMNRTTTPAGSISAASTRDDGVDHTGRRQPCALKHFLVVVGRS